MRENNKQEFTDWLRLRLRELEQLQELEWEQLRLREREREQRSYFLQKSSFINHFDSAFPEEWRNDLQTKIKRMKRRKKPEKLIIREKITVRLSWILSFVRIKFENLWLSKNRKS